MRLRTVSASDAGWSRLKRGRGFSYVDRDGRRLTPEEVERCQQLVIPPAWTEVWICPHQNGHLQAVGYDEAGRKQYLYHPHWRLKRDAAKFDHSLEVAAALPAARRRVTRDLRLDGMPRERAAAAAFRMLDLGVFRIGSQVYADEHGSVGLTTLERDHVSLSGATASFEFTGKSGQEQSISITDADSADALRAMRRRRGGDRMLAYKEGSRWRELGAEQVNAYLKERLGEDASAKDFRTWHGTVMAAVALASSDAASPTARKKAVSSAMKEVAELLGNTPAVARSSYVDPRVIDLFNSGVRLATTSVGATMTTRQKVERDVIALLTA